MLDTYFYIIIFHGDTVAQWRKAGYHKMVDEASGKLQYETFSKQVCAHAMQTQFGNDTDCFWLRRRFPCPLHG